MKTLLATVPLFNRLSKAFDDASLFQGIDNENFAHIEGRWRPMFDQRTAQAKVTGESRSEINAEDAHWEWGKKMIAATKDPFVFDIFALECAGSTQAMMLVRKGGEKCFSRHNEHPRAPIIYVDFLATAPWNRKRLVREPVYKGGGRILISTAVSLSIEEEMQGRIGLHSLQSAEEFYRTQIGMADLGKDNDYQGLRYFELPASKAVHFFANP
jgi:hypothetical protein